MLLARLEFTLARSLATNGFVGSNRCLDAERDGNLDRARPNDRDEGHHLRDHHGYEGLGHLVVVAGMLMIATVQTFWIRRYCDQAVSTGGSWYSGPTVLAAPRF
jgi:hypothetical protein